MKPETAIVQQAEETEQQLIDRIKNMDSQTAWSVGAMISRLKSDFNLTDEQISERTGLSRETVTQRRQVWESFSDCKTFYEGGVYPTLSWSHFHAALTWDDAPECLQWAFENNVSVRGMKAWRRSQHGEDLETPADDTRWNEEEKQDTRFDVSEPEAPNDDELPTLQSMQGIAKETIDKPAVEGVRELRESKEATPRRDQPSPIEKVFDTLEHSIQQLRDYQELVSIREKANHLAAMVTEKIRRIDEEG